MKRRGNAQPLSMSFLDILACALGGVLALLLLSAARNRDDAQVYQSTLASMEARSTHTLAQLEGVNRALDELGREHLRAQQELVDAAAHNRALQAAADAAISQAQSQSDALQKASDAIRQTQTQIIGLRGPLRNVVFVFDTSGSMGTPRFGEYRDTLKSWVNYLPMDQFGIVDYDSGVRLFRAELIPATQANRAAACRFIDAFVADGMTDTCAALARAFNLKNVDTVVLFSDGEPTAPFPQGGGQVSAADVQRNIELVEQWLAEKNQARGVIVNCVAMGKYFKTAYGEFLQRVARDHGGVFIGR